MQISKTNKPCECDALQRWADEPDIPILFNEEMNEYRFVHTNGKGYTIIRHCPFCGGKAPTSHRKPQYMKVPRPEYLRLSKIVTRLKTSDEVIAALGPPDADIEIGSIVTVPETDDKPNEITPYRTLRYSGLSKTADVRVEITPDGRVAGFSFFGKPIGSPPAKE